MEIIEFYNECLTSLGGNVNNEGVVMRPDGKPFEVGGKILVVPTRDRLKENDWTSTHPFHPMCEDAVMGQSETIHWLAKTVKASMTMSISGLMCLLLEAAIKPELQEQAKDPKLMDMLSSCKNAKATTLQAWNKIWPKFAKDLDLLNIALNRGGSIDGEKYHRVCKVHFPMLDDTDPDALLCGVKMSKNDKHTIQGLLSYILAGVTLQYGSNDTVPYFHSLMSMYASFVKRINFFAKITKRINGPKPISTDWIIELNDLRQFVNKIPKLAGNEGRPSRAKKPETETVVSGNLGGVYDRVKVETRQRDEPAANDDDRAPWVEEPKEVLSSTTKPATAGAIKLSDIITNRKPTFEELRSGERASDRLLPRSRADRYDDRYPSRYDDRYDRDYRDDRRDSRSDRYDDRLPSRGNNLTLSDLMGRGRR